MLHAPRLPTRRLLPRRVAPPFAPRAYGEACSNRSPGGRLPDLITHRHPETWQELEDLVRDILAECGMTAERQVHVKLLRGGVDVDVVATEVVQGITTRIICECKHWESSVPQQVVHGFRTVLSETGAHRGYIISKAGFQSGAYEAAEKTNVELLTLEEFQGTFFERWASRRLECLEAAVGSFNTYYEGFGIPGIDELEDPAVQDAYYRVWRKHLPIGVALPGFSPYLRLHRPGQSLPNLPFVFRPVEGEALALPADIAALSGYREFLAGLQAHAEAALAELRTHNPLTNGA